VFDGSGTSGFLGSSSGLIIFDPATKLVSSPIGNIPGTVLAVNPAGTEVLIANGGETLLYNVNPKTVNVLNISNAVSADFTPDGAKAFVLSSNHCTGQTTGGCLFTVQPGAAISSTPLPSTPPFSPVGVQRLSILASGQVGYIAYGGVPFSSFETCNGQLSGQGSLLVPDLVQTLPDGSMIIGAEPAYTDEIGVVLSGNGCAPTPTNTETQQLFGSNFNARQIIVTPNSHDAYVTSDAAGQVFHYNVGLGTATPISLSNAAATTFTGGATPDSANVYIGGSDNAVHRINVANSTDAQQIPLSFTPDLVAVRP